MSTAEKNTVEIYADSMQQKIVQLEEDLNDLSAILVKRAFSRHE